MTLEQRLERIRERAEGLGLIIFDGCGEEFKICQGHVKHIFPIRDSSLILSYHGEPDKKGTEFSIQEAERLLSALERKPGVRVEIRQHDAGGVEACNSECILNNGNFGDVECPYGYEADGYNITGPDTSIFLPGPDCPAIKYGTKTFELIPIYEDEDEKT